MANLEILPKNLPIGCNVIVGNIDTPNKESLRGVLIGFIIEVNEAYQIKMKGVVRYEQYSKGFSRMKTYESNFRVERLTPIESLDVNEGNKITDIKAFKNKSK